MTLIVYYLKTCDTCRKAIKALQAAEHELDLFDVRADGITKEQLAPLVMMVGYEKLLNTRSTTWRGLDESDKSDMDQDKALDLMLEHPTLIKRPVIDTGDGVFVGWSKDVQAEFI